MTSTALSSRNAELATFDPRTPEYESIAAQRPDLILVFDSELEEDSIVRYREIAPVIAVPIVEPLPMLASIFGEEDRARNLQSDSDAALAAIDAPAGLGLTVVFAVANRGAYVFTAPGSPVSKLAAAAGTPLTDREGGSPKELGFAVAEEQLGVLDDDRLWLAVPYPGSAASADALEASPVFQRIPAVIEGRYRRLTTEQSLSVQFPSVLSTETTVATLTDLLS